MMLVCAARGVTFSSRSALPLQGRHRSCFLMTALPMIINHNQSCAPTMGALILTRYRGWIRTAAITSRQAHIWSRRTSTISRDVSPGAPISPVWALTTKATESRSAHPQPTTDLCRANTLRGALRRQEHSPTYDLPYFRGRLPLRTRFTISIPLLPLPGCIGWFRSRKRDSSLVLTDARQHWK